MSFGAKDFAQALGDLAQQRVALVVAERVVDLLEAVEVDQQQRADVAHPRRAEQRARAHGVQRGAVGKPRQVVLLGLTRQPA